MSSLAQLEALFAEREPAVLALVPEEGRFDRLRREAAELETRFPDPANRPPLYGVPVGIKDIFHVAGFTAQAGSHLPPGVLQGQEGPAVTALRAAGALILGKTVSTEFAYFAPGPTRNPRNPEHTPGGSSSGSAAAVGAGLCPLALGTQTIGSIIRPAAYCGVVGFKPSYDRISKEGVIPLAPSFDHVGIFAPDVATVQRAARVLCRGWRPVTPRSKAAGKPRLGLPEGPYLESAWSEGQSHFQRVAERLASAGYEIALVPMFSDFEEINTRHRRIVAAEAAGAHVAAGWYPRFADLYERRTVELIERGLAVSDADLARDLEDGEMLRPEIESVMDREGIDLWISPPAQGSAPRGLASTGDPIMNIPWTQAGLPALCLPAGQNGERLPMGLQLVGRFGEDETVIELGGGLEAELRRSRR
ncbi:MAG TPA: amidase [Thermoanaerobaculia bacterium]|jgi:Asp-tRNA(Asn)/Glu-tRNA(Gln) amidotransferase A subunit family amidase|nr:amidase [Thermoanaerobaculia bacterium]